MSSTKTKKKRHGRLVQYLSQVKAETYLACVLQVQVWDTAGQERFRKSMVEHYYRNVHAVVFVYDVTKMASFRNLWRAAIGFDPSR